MVLSSYKNDFDHESSPLLNIMSSLTKPNESSDDGDVLVPIAKPISLTSKTLSFIKFILITLPLYIFGSAVAIVIFAVFTFTGVGPLLEHYLSCSDRKALGREKLLKEHPEMFVLEIPGDINKASQGRPYKVMVRLTRPMEVSQQMDQASLPPVIFPGGLAANLMTMAKHQDMLTSQHGFTVVNFDRLGVGLSDPYPTHIDGGLVSPSAADVAREMNYVMTHCGVASDPSQKWYVRTACCWF